MALVDELTFGKELAKLLPSSFFNEVPCKMVFTGCDLDVECVGTYHGISLAAYPFSVGDLLQFTADKVKKQKCR